MNGENKGTFSGFVTSVQVKGIGKNSAELIFSVHSSGMESKAFVVLSNEATNVDPQLFHAKSAVVAAAFATRTEVDVEWEYVHPTPVAVSILVPAAKSS